MRNTLLFALLVAAVVATQATAGPATANAKLKVCGQIKNGPAHDWSFPAATARQLGIPARVKGTTWTVIVDRVACGFAMQQTRALLKQWPKASPGERMAGPAGWTCAKDKGFVGQGGKGSPGGSCLKVGGLFTFLGTGPYTLAQIKQLAATGKLPG